MNKFILKLGFIPKENSSDVFIKKYQDNFEIEVDFAKEKINYGKIKTESETTSNFSQAENLVVLECINRLLEKGYKPEDIILEKTWKTGHGTSGRLDILVKKEGKSFLMIECKTWGREFEKEYKNLQKDGGQLFTYFQQDNNADFLLLYTSKFDEEKNELEYKNEIVIIEKSYRETSNVKDLFERWNKFSKDNGVFEDWVNAYNFESKALRLQDLKNIKQEDSSFIFNRFLEILRHNAVSDKPNAFNKVFTLFLCKVKDEDKNPEEELEFQWKEGEDTNISFQKRLSDMYKKAMKEFLEKEITDVSDEDFERDYGQLEPSLKEKLKKEFTKIRLQKSNEFAIKDVFDEETFEENGVVLKEVVELLQNYKFRYNKKQPFLGDFFELLLTTGLKQEVGQFFTPVPIARFICKSVPLKQKTEEKLQKGETNELLPNVIDYAAGSGHFLTESMEEVQNIIETLDISKFSPRTQKELNAWQINQFDWAYQYIYGVERDYRLVKTTKVGCYLHGDGIANVIHGDGLDDFDSPKYRNKLQKKTVEKENRQFDFVLSNPPYSVSAFKGNTKANEKTSDLYKSLTDQSSEIEALFIERTAQLLKEGGIAALILPSSILSNSGIYTKAREILLKNFEFVAITELGSNTFMATGTNTVVLFLKRRSTTDFENIQNLVKKNLSDKKDVTINGIEKSFSKYLQHIWEDITFADYKTLLEKNPNKKIQNHEIFQEYEKKIKAKNEAEKWQKILELEQEKISYFLLTSSQKVVLVKTGEKKAEKQFLGYEFSNRRGSEGIHPIQRGKQIDECTKLFNPEYFYNPEKASTYILEAFEEKEEREISENLQKNISRVNLVDMLTCDRVEFEKTISLNVKKKIQIESKFPIVTIGDIAKTQYGFTEKAESKGKVRYLRITDLNDDGSIKNNNEQVFINPSKETEEQFLLKPNDIVIARSGSVGKSGFYTEKHEPMIFASYLIRLYANIERVISKYLFLFTQTKFYWDQVEANSISVTQPNLNAEKIKNFKIPLPPKNIQQKIVDEIEVLEKREREIIGMLEEMKKEIENLFQEGISKAYKSYRLSDSDIFEISIGKRVLKNEFVYNGKIPVYSANVFEPFGNIDKLLFENFDRPSVLWGIDGDWMVNFLPANTPFYPTDHCGVLRVKNNQVNERFIAYCLEKEGENFGFSRTKRASIDRIQGIKISLPPLPEQQKIVSQIEKIAEKIENLEKNLSEISQQKEKVLKKYL